MGTFDFYDCPTCGTKGIIPTSDNMCPNCKKPLPFIPQEPCSTPEKQEAYSTPAQPDVIPFDTAQPDISMNWLRIDYSSGSQSANGQTKDPVTIARQKLNQPRVSRFRQNLSHDKKKTDADCVLHIFICEDDPAIADSLPGIGK